ncbi:MAG: OmpA family protein [Bacteroidales bacterium]|nr:OmpA family protein [Bacteroidales bacterium]
MNKVYLTIIVLSFLLNACVSTKLYKELEQEKAAYEQQVGQLLEENEELKVAGNEFGSKKSALKDKVALLEQDSIRRNLEIKQLEKEIASLSKQYDHLKAAQQELLKGSASETKGLLEQLQANQQDLQMREDKLYALEKSLDEERDNLTRLKLELEARNKRLIELEDILFKKDSAVNALKNKVSEALLGFRSQGLEVSLKNGKVYVSLDEKLLFNTGSTQVDPKGASALKSLARVLEQNKDINITIEGHTDDVPVSPNPEFKDNWDLSVKRATAIVRILLDGTNVSPVRLTAAGRGEFLPVATGKTTQDRQKKPPYRDYIDPQA